MTKLQKRAEIARKYLVNADPDGRIVRSDDAPEWHVDFCRKAHGMDILPDDYRYQLIADALDAIEEGVTVEEFADNVDIGALALMDWAASHSRRVDYADEALKLLEGERRLMMDVLATAQYTEREEVYERTLAALEEVPA